MLIIYVHYTYTLYIFINMHFLLGEIVSSLILFFIKLLLHFFFLEKLLQLFKFF